MTGLELEVAKGIRSVPGAKAGDAYGKVLEALSYRRDLHPRDLVQVGLRGVDAGASDEAKFDHFVIRHTVAPTFGSFLSLFSSLGYEGAGMQRLTRRRIGAAARLCQELGAGLLENGAEISRVEETIRLTARRFGLNGESVVTPTGITLTLGDDEPVTSVIRIHSRGIDLTRVALLNALSRTIQVQALSLEEARREVASIRGQTTCYPVFVCHFCVALAGGCFALLAGASWSEMMAAVVAGGMAEVVLGNLDRRFPPFLNFFAASALTTLFATALGVWGLSAETVTVGALTPQLPGLSLVAAMRDLMNGELVAGVARAAEALLVAMAMAAGVVFGLSLSGRLGW